MAQLIQESISTPMVDEAQGLDSTSWGPFALGGAGSQFDDVNECKNNSGTMYEDLFIQSERKSAN